MYVKASGNTVQQFPYSLGNLKVDNPQVSFPDQITDETLASYGVFPVVKDPEPNFNPDTQRLEAQNNPALIGGQWRMGWNVIPLDADSRFVKKRRSAIPNNYDTLDIEALDILRNEVQHFDNGSQAATPGCALVAGILGVNENAIRNAVRTKANSYREAILTAWAERRAAKGGA
jgi:hypothetical protein